MRMGKSGFTFIELMVSVTILVIMISIMSFGYKNYEARYLCQSAAQVLAMDIRLQQQRAKKFDMEQGICFISPTEYHLGTCNGTVDDKGGTVSPFSNFTEPPPLRIVNLTQNYRGVSVSSIYSSITSVTTSPVPNHYYFGFDPKALDSSNPTKWAPISGFQGTIKLIGGGRTIDIIVKANQEVTVQIE
jgi:prepilin-type N-terminal cleavage/methylation domain-containing protein